MSAILIFTSPTIKLSVGDASPTPHEAVHQDWLIREAFEPDVFLYKGESYGAYHISLEIELPDDEDPGNVYIEGKYLARDLDHLSVYVTGRPLSDRGFDLFMSPVLPPLGWRSNAAQVLPPDDWSMLSTPVRWASPYQHLPRLPLKEILDGLSAYRDSDSLTYTLASFHYQGLTAFEDDEPLLLLARAMEMVRELLRGSTISEKESSLPPKVARGLKQSLNWIFEMSNTRRTTRHPVTKKPELALHPEMRAEEEADFLHDADLLIRYVVSNRLGLFS